MRSIFFIDRTTLYYYGGNIRAPLSLQPPNNVLVDMEVISTEQLAALIENFLKTNKIQPCETIIFFSTRTYFQKDFPKDMKLEDFEIQKNQFIENVPFDNILNETYPQKKDANTVIAINKEFAYALRDIMIRFGFMVVGITPAFALFGDQQINFNINTAQEIIKHFSSLEKMSLPLTEKETVTTNPEADEFKQKDNSKMRIYLMIGAFAVLLVVLIYMIFFFRKPPPKKTVKSTVSKSAVVPKAQATLVTTVAPTLVETVTPEITIDKTQIIIRILNATDSTSKADEVKVELTAAGYTNVVVSTAPTQESENVSIVVKSSLPIASREEISRIVESLNLQTRVRENNEIDVDALITIFK